MGNQNSSQNNYQNSSQMEISSNSTPKVAPKKLFEQFETVFISINVHGCIEIKNTNASGFRIPADINNFYKINVVSPSLSNIVDTVTDSSIDTLNKLEKCKGFQRYNNSKEVYVDEINNNIRSIIFNNMETIGNVSNNIAKWLKWYYFEAFKDKPFDAYSREFTDNLHRGFQVINCLENNRGRTMINKIYTITGEHSPTEDWSIRCLNFNYGQSPDLFEEIAGPNTRIGKSITTEELLKYLVKNGARNIVIIDLSCNVFCGDNVNLSDRNTRSLKNNPENIIGFPYGGKKNRKFKYNKSKSKKNNKSKYKKY